MDIELEKVTGEGRIALRHLFELAAYDLSELSGSDIHECGRFITNPAIIDWFDDPNYSPFFIRANGRLAGFVIIKYIVEEEIYYLNHFFVLRKYRNQHIGKQAASMAFDRFEGYWRVSQFDWNLPAQKFWRKVLASYTNGTYTETRRKDNKGPMQEFKADWSTPVK